MSKEETLSPSPQPQQNDTVPPAPTNRRNRPSRACTIRAAARMVQQQQAVMEKKQKKEQQQQQRQVEVWEEDLREPEDQCGANGGPTGKVVTRLVGPPEPAQFPRWTLRSMWELASVLNFLNVFRDHLNVQAEFSAEELETALITPNDTLGYIHIPLLKAIPPNTRTALTRDTWITVLCRKLRDWWHWVANGELPLVASHGMEAEVYRTLDPGVRVVILKALCDIRVEQEDMRNHIDISLKHGTHLSLFRKERVGGDSQGINYWYEDDPAIGHRLYREIRKVEMKKAKIKGSSVLPCTMYQWETVATNFEEFREVSEKLFTSKNRTEASLGKRLKNDMLPEIEKVHKRKERLLKKQHRQALLLDSFLAMDGLVTGRSLRDRKPVSYTFDDYDRSISEAIKVTKNKPPPPDSMYRRDSDARPEVSENGKWSEPSHSNYGPSGATLPDSPDYDELDEEHKPELLDQRRRQRPQRYLVEAVSDNDVDSESVDIVGEAVYDEEYLRKRNKRRKFSSSSEGDEEYRWDHENGEEEEEEEEEEEDDVEDSSSTSEESDEPQKFKKLPGRTQRETKLRSVGEVQSGLRRSRRVTRINYSQYELSESENDSMKLEKANESDEHFDASENAEYSSENEDSDVNDNEPEMKVDQPAEGYFNMAEKDENQPPEKSNGPDQDEVEGVKHRRFLDLNELAPGSGFDDGPNTILKDNERDHF